MPPSDNPQPMNPRIPRWVGWPLVAVFTYGLMAYYARRAVFHPAPYPEGMWELEERFKPENVWITAPDGVRLHGWLLRASNESGSEKAGLITLYFHGNAGNLTNRVLHMEAIPKTGSDLLIIDYRGFGKSEGKPTESGVYQDAEAAYEFLLSRGWKPSQIVLYGESLGTAVAVDLAARRPCAGVVLEAPFPSARAVAHTVIPYLGLIVASGLETGEKIGKVDAPLFILHGTEDPVIRYELGRRVFEAAPEPKQFWTVEGAHHSDIPAVAQEEYVRRLTGFYGTLSQGKSARRRSLRQ